MEKSELLLTSDDNQLLQQLTDVLGCKGGSFPFSYLGLPLSDKALPKTAYVPLLQKINNRLQGWAARQLSIAGRLVLINAVLSSIPTYFMSVFKLPVWVIQEIDKTRRKFLWKRNSSDERGIPLANWDLVCTPKKFGGLGVIDLKVFNEALLAKWYWYWIKSEERLWKSLFLTFFQMDRPSDLPDCKFFKQTLKSIQSFCECYMRRIVGDGSRIKFWEHNWGHGFLYRELPLLYEEATDKHVSVQQAFQQNFSKLLTITGPVQQSSLLAQYQQLQNLMANQSPLTIAQDEVEWTLTKTKEFSVKSMYQRLKEESRTTVIIHKVWKMKVPPRIKVFGWLTYHERILTTDNLQKRGWNLSSMCVLCRANVESIKHLFSECPFSLEVYATLTGTFQLPSRNWRRKLQEEDAHKWIVQNEGDSKSKEILLLAMFI